MKEFHERLKLNSKRWVIRRRIINLTLLFCASCVIYLMLKGDDTQLSQSIVNGAFLLAGSVIGSYIFGATWDDKNDRDVQPYES